jgi:hypothetical protein
MRPSGGAVSCDSAPLGKSELSFSEACSPWPEGRSSDGGCVDQHSRHISPSAAQITQAQRDDSTNRSLGDSARFGSHRLRRSTETPVSSPVDRLVAERGFPRWTAGSRTAAAATRPASAATSNSSIVSSPQFVATSSSISTGNRRACPTVRRHEDGRARLVPR